LIIGLGASLGMLWLALSTREEARIRWLLLGLGVQAGMFIGARAAFVLEHLNYYSTRRAEILNPSAGGLWWPGAVIGGLLVILIIGLTSKEIKLTFDAFRVFLIPMAVSFWLAAWSAGVAYGARLDPSIWWGVPMLDLNGVTAPRVPVQPAAALTLLALLGGIEWMWKGAIPAGRKSGVMLLVLGVHTLLFSFMRVDPVQPVLDIRLDVWAAILLVLITLVFLATTFDVKSRRKRTAEKEGIE
jgi:prolipoprotein diacylglyceryltransferase